MTLNLSPRQNVVQFAHMLQQDLFPVLESVVGALSPQIRLLASVMSLSPLEAVLSTHRASTGRPARDRAALATAFMAKAVLNLPTTRDLMSRLHVDESLRQFCGWQSGRAVPHESKFSRAFAEFAASGLPQRLHEAVIAATQKNRLIGHIARDATAIPAREKITEETRARQKARHKDIKEKARANKRRKRQQAREQSKALRAGSKGKRTKPAAAEQKPGKAGGGKGSRGPHPRAVAAERGTRVQRQRRQKLDQMLSELPTQCDVGRKTSSQGHENYWEGYKLHLDIADGQIPVSAVLTSASVHDSQVAIPLMTMTSSRVDYLYELMDSAYDAKEIHAHSKQLNHVAIVAPHPRNGLKRSEQLPGVFADKSRPGLEPAQKERFKERTMAERVNARLKDEFGARHLRVRGAAKVMAHLMFGVVALTVDQWLRLGLKS